MSEARTFVGRQSELARVSAALRQRKSVLILGEAGVGKTHLVVEAGERLEREGVRVLASACLPLATRLPLFPVVNLLRDLHQREGGRVLESVLATCPGYVSQELVRVLPELGQAEMAPAEAWQQQRLFAALNAIWSAVAGQGPAVAIVEDVHWADQTSRDFVSYVLASRGCRTPLLMTARNDAPYPDDVDDWLLRIGLQRNVDRFVLPSLTSAEVSQLATALGVMLSEQDSAGLWKRTAGNAFFVEQLLATGGAQPDGPVPEHVAELLTSRAQRLPAAHRHVLNALAVAARSLSESELVAITQLDAPTVRGALRYLATSRLTRFEGRTGVMARHALLAEAVAQGLLPGERIELHARVASILTGRADSSLAAEVALHWAQAERATDELPARVSAAEHAERILAYAQAALHWERAVELAPPEVPGNVAEFALRGMIAWEHAGESSRAARLGERGLPVGVASADPHRYATTLARLAHLHHIADRARGRAELAEAIRIFDGLPASADKGHALHLMYRFHRAASRQRSGMPYLMQAIEVSTEASEAAPVLTRALASLAHEQFTAGDSEHGMDTLRRAHLVAAQLSDLETFGWLAVTETDIRLKLNQLDEAIALGAQGRQRLDEEGLGTTFLAAVLTGNLTEALREQGRIAEAGAIIDPLTGDLDIHRDEWLLHLERSLVDLARGQLPAAAARVATILSVPIGRSVELDSDLARSRAELALWQGDPETAVDLASAGLTGLVGSEDEWRAAPLLVLGLRGCSDLTESAAAQRDAARLTVVEARRAELLSLLAALITDPFAPHPFWTTAAAEGADWRAELARGHGAEYAAPWDDAAAGWEALGRPHRAAYARWRQTQVLLTTGRRAEAVTCLEAAIGLAREHVPLLTSIRSLAHLARIELATNPGGDRGGEVPPDPPRPFDLTARELDVLRLLVDGLTNPEIGARLYMSPRTASVHVTAILRKLGANNRVHAAAIAQRAGIGPAES